MFSAHSIPLSLQQIPPDNVSPRLRLTKKISPKGTAYNTYNTLALAHCLQNLNTGIIYTCGRLLQFKKMMYKNHFTLALSITMIFKLHTCTHAPWPCKRNFSPWALDEQYIQLFSYTPMMLAYITYLMNNQSGEWVPVTSNEEYHML